MLQVFYIDVAKVDRGVAYLAIAIHVCLKCMFQMFFLFHTYVASISSRCCKYRSGCCIMCNGYIRMLQVYVPNVSSVLYIRCKCFIWTLER
jgi:hypothetical protein